jgi:hypothetical protein
VEAMCQSVISVWSGRRPYRLRLARHTKPGSVSIRNLSLEPNGKFLSLEPNGKFVSLEPNGKFQVPGLSTKKRCASPHSNNRVVRTYVRGFGTFGTYVRGLRLKGLSP